MGTEFRTKKQTHLSRSKNSGIYNRFFKRPMDLVLSLCAIVLLLPVFIVIAILVRVQLGSPVIYTQKRPGRYGEIFTLYKFRTMTDETDEWGKALPDGVRLRAFGRLLRSTSLDEIPELFNVINGNMSIVGPRPLLVQYLPLYDENQKRRHEVRPGLTGLAQIRGRNAISWDDKFNFDIQYVDNISLFSDIKIVIVTVLKVFIREGINSENSVTVEPFKGNHVGRNNQ